VLYLSHYFKQHRAEYYERLQAVRDRGEWEQWLTFFLNGVVQVASEATETARRVLRLRESYRTTITERFGRVAGNGHKVLESLFDRPIISVENVVALTDTSFASANGLVARMVEAGIVVEMTGFARNRRFRFDSYVRLFDEGTSPGS
jgi:Fic family protein